MSRHPPREMRIRFAAGTLGRPFDLGVALHLETCAACQAEVARWEDLGGTLLDALSPLPLASDALARATNAAGATHASGEPLAGSALPTVGGGREIVPGLHITLVWRPERGRQRAFLLRGRPGRALPRHDHGGLEMTCVMQGGYADELGAHRPGDCVVVAPGQRHRPRVDTEEDCVCLVMFESPPRPTGVLGLLLRLFM